jgi:hypothetical protein
MDEDKLRIIGGDKPRPYKYGRQTTDIEPFRSNGQAGNGMETVKKYFGSKKSLILVLVAVMVDVINCNFCPELFIFNAAASLL